MDTYIHVLGLPQPFRVDQNDREKVRQLLLTPAANRGVFTFRTDAGSWVVSANTIIAIEDRAPSPASQTM